MGMERRLSVSHGTTKTRIESGVEVDDKAGAG